MALLCILYFVTVSACLGGAGVLVEYALPATAPRRWIWGAVIALSVVAPPFISLHHSAPAIELWGHQLVQLSVAHAHGNGTATTLTGAWLDCASAPYADLVARLSVLSSVGLLAWGAASAWRVARLPRRARVVDGVPVVVTESLGPATVGVWRSRVLLPRWVLALPCAQRRYVVRHEEEHRRAHDAALLGVAAILVSLVPWNVALWWQLRRLRLAVEIDCDRRVVSALGDATAYGELLLRVAEAASRGPRLQPALLGGAGMLERRLTWLLAPAPRRLVRRLLAPALACVLLLIVFSMPHPSPSPSHASTAATHASH
jgi:hypothetical protein